jgi:hypothetical protein
MDQNTEKATDGGRSYPIRIDETTYQVDEPIVTGLTILALAGKDAETHFVTQILEGKDDIVVAATDEVDVSQPGREHFTTVVKPKKDCEIVVNTRHHKWDAKTITFEQVVDLAFPDRSGDNPQTVTYTVNYRCGHPSQPEGPLVAGSRAKVRCGMVFDVDRTDRS